MERGKVVGREASRQVGEEQAGWTVSYQGEGSHDDDERRIAGL